MITPFEKTVSFQVKGELYDPVSSPEIVMENYDWSFEYHDDGNVQIFGHHRDSSGRIVNIDENPDVSDVTGKDSIYILE